METEKYLPKWMANMIENVQMNGNNGESKKKQKRQI